MMPRKLTQLSKLRVVQTNQFFIRWKAFDCNEVLEALNSTTDKAGETSNHYSKDI